MRWTLAAASIQLMSSVRMTTCGRPARRFEERLGGFAVVAEIVEDFREHVVRALRDRGLETGFVKRFGEHVALLLVVGGEVGVVILADVEGAGDAPLQRRRGADVEE